MLGLSLGCVGRGDLPTVRDATKLARINTVEAGLVVRSPVHLASREGLARCRPGRGASWVFDPGHVSPTHAFARLQGSAIDAARWAPDARLVRAELRCDVLSLSVVIEGTWYSRLHREVWWSRTGLASRSKRRRVPDPMDLGIVRRRLGGAAGRWVRSFSIDAS